MTEDEKCVREYWEKVETYMQSGEYEEPWKFFTTNALYGACRAKTHEELWAKAAEFTRTRLEQIRDVEEEMALLEEVNVISQYDFNSSSKQAFSRILARETEALEALRRGMK